MSNKFLSKMLYALTSAYSRKDYDNVQLGLPLETNIGKLSRSRPSWYDCGMTLTMPVALCLTAMARTSALSGSVLTIDSTGSPSG